MSTLDAALHLAVESTYGTYVAGTRSFEAKADSWKREAPPIESIGFRAGMETVRSDRRVQVNHGGSASTEIDVLTKGMGLLLSSIFPTVSGPTQVAATTAYEQTHSSGSAASSDSFSIQQVRPHTDGSTPQAFSHLGCKATGFTISAEVGGLLTLSIDWDFQDVTTSESTATATYPASSVVFDWSQITIEVDDVAVNAKSFELSGDLGLATDRRYLKGSALKEEPVRAAVPNYTVALELDYDDEDRYDEWVAGSIHKVELHAVGVADGIESGYENEFLVTANAVQWDGESPEVDLESDPKQALAGRVLDNGTDAAVEVYIQSTDTAI